MLQLDPLAVGRKITIWPFQSNWNLPENALAAIEDISPEKIWLRLSKPVPPLPLQAGEPVRVQSTTKEALYFWNAEVFEVSDSARERLMVSILDDGVILPWREHSDRYTPHPLGRLLNDSRTRS
jgi:hypothetical protein